MSYDTECFVCQSHFQRLSSWSGETTYACAKCAPALRLLFQTKDPEYLWADQLSIDRYLTNYNTLPFQKDGQGETLVRKHMCPQCRTFHN